MPRNLQDLPPDMASKLSQLLTNPIGFTGHIAQWLRVPPPHGALNALVLVRADVTRSIIFDGVGVLIAHKNSFFGSVAHYSGPFPPRRSFGPRVLLPSLDNCHPI